MRKIATKKSSKKSPKKSLTNKLKEAEDRVESIPETIDRLVFCIYARNGQGKTTFGASGPKPIIIDCEGGTPSVRKHKDAKRFVVNTWRDIDIIYWYLKSGKHDRQTVVLDTVTALSALCMKFVLGDESSRDPTKDPDMPTKREWGKVGELMKTVLMNFMGLDMHVVFLAQERKSFVDEDSDELPEVYPSLSASSRELMTAHANLIGRMYTKRVVVKDGKKKKKRLEHRMLVAPHSLYLAKVNVEDHGLPDIIIDPTIPKIVNMMNGVKKGKPKSSKPKKKSSSSSKKKGAKSGQKGK